MPDVGNTIDYTGLGKNTALIRELHVYGQVAKINSNEDSNNKTQHTGVGRTVMTIAEQVATKAQYHRLSVIAGVGVKEYYRKQL